MNAVSCCGLQLYNFGETVSIPYWTEKWQPDSFFEKIIANFSRNLHTLCLLGQLLQINLKCWYCTCNKLISFLKFSSCVVLRRQIRDHMMTWCNKKRVCTLWVATENSQIWSLFSDIKVKEPTEESLTKKVRQYMDPKFMSVKEAASQLVQIIERNPDSGVDKYHIPFFSSFQMVQIFVRV